MRPHDQNWLKTSTPVPRCISSYLSVKFNACSCSRINVLGGEMVKSLLSGGRRPKASLIIKNYQSLSFIYTYIYINIYIPITTWSCLKKTYSQHRPTTFCFRKHRLKSRSFPCHPTMWLFKDVCYDARGSCTSVYIYIYPYI